MVIVTGVAELEDRYLRCPRWGRRCGWTPGSAGKIKRSKGHCACLNSNLRAHEPPRSRKVALPSPAFAQSGGLVSLGRRGLRQSASGKQTDPPEHWLLNLPLVPCDGARILR